MSDLSLDEMLNVMREFREKHPPPPKANDGQCKACGAIIGEQFGGLINTPAIPIHTGPVGLGGLPMGPPFCYVCPECLEALKQATSP